MPTSPPFLEAKHWILESSPDSQPWRETRSTAKNYNDLAKINNNPTVTPEFLLSPLHNLRTDQVIQD
ncbi:hypothetical protein N7495_005588 [Penicillium taxi]|uniref:uncharacterized protein n=1 Tax=Penicillium taxi TaxID=168475 RepID=UPI0025456573|nr:uncharacterized protein N7495_005588 [Penicillium taxi]KAJ5893897.1 hypothetical protein N7495_005588 [Penicillium taxi]